MSDFTPDRSKANGHKSWCRPCVAARQRRYRATIANDKKRRASMALQKDAA